MSQPRTLLWSLLLGLVCALGAAPLAVAQPAAPAAEAVEQPATEDAARPTDADTTGTGRSASTFQPAEGTGEETPGYTLMVAAYLVLWVLIGLYALLLWRRQRNIGGELAGLRARLDALDEATRVDDPS